MPAKRIQIVVAVAGLLLLSGCTSQFKGGTADVITPDDVNQSLVMVGGELQELALLSTAHAPWEDSRNDGATVQREIPIFAPWIFVEVRHRENLSTINARPREFSSTVTRSIRRELRPAP